ncbi:hypothetical protein BGZ83_000399 [Gryganskiella cystojenkinii]|nr:hypothetical protein BGZ83_000399 [Gryganskiella cystojenkinii]
MAFESVDGMEGLHGKNRLPPTTSSPSLEMNASSPAAANKSFSASLTVNLTASQQQQYYPSPEMTLLDLEILASKNNKSRMTTTESAAAAVSSSFSSQEQGHKVSSPPASPICRGRSPFFVQEESLVSSTAQIHSPLQHETATHFMSTSSFSELSNTNDSLAKTPNVSSPSRWSVSPAAATVGHATPPFADDLVPSSQYSSQHTVYYSGQSPLSLSYYNDNHLVSPRFPTTPGWSPSLDQVNSQSPYYDASSSPSTQWTLLPRSSWWMSEDDDGEEPYVPFDYNTLNPDLDPNDDKFYIQDGPVYSHKNEVNYYDDDEDNDMDMDMDMHDDSYAAVGFTCYSSGRLSLSPSPGYVPIDRYSDEAFAE